MLVADLRKRLETIQEDIMSGDILEAQLVLGRLLSDVIVEDEAEKRRLLQSVEDGKQAFKLTQG